MITSTLQTEPIFRSDTARGDRPDGLGVVGDGMIQPDDGLSGGIPMRSQAWLNAWLTHIASAQPPATHRRGTSSQGNSSRGDFLRGNSLRGSRISRASDNGTVAHWRTTRHDGRVIAHLPLVPFTPSSLRRSGHRPHQWHAKRCPVDWQLAGARLACGDHLGLRCAPEDAITVADSLADAICEPGRWHWRRLRLEGILAGEPSTMAWLKAMADRGNLIRFRSKMNVWFKPAANTWEDFLATHSKRTRSKLRQLLRLVDNDVALEPVLLTQPADVIKQLPSFIDLHQRRWNAVGQPGSFASSAMRDFINTLTTQLAPSGQIRIAGLQHGQQLIAGELHLIGLDSRRYVYSMGVDPAFRGQSPGTILNAITMRECIASGCAGVDFLRGDEEYKSRLRAAPVPLLEIDVFAATPAGRRAAMYDAAWMKARQIWRRRRGEPAIDEWSFQNGIVGDELPSTTGAVLRWNDYGELLPQWIATPERESGTVETPLRSSVWTGAVDTSGRVIPAINSVASSTMDV